MKWISCTSLVLFVFSCITVFAQKKNDKCILRTFQAPEVNLLQMAGFWFEQTAIPNPTIPDVVRLRRASVLVNVTSPLSVDITLMGREPASMECKIRNLRALFMSPNSNALIVRGLDRNSSPAVRYRVVALEPTSFFVWYRCVVMNVFDGSCLIPSVFVGTRDETPTNRQRKQIKKVLKKYCVDPTDDSMKPDTRYVACHDPMTHLAPFGIF